MSTLNCRYNLQIIFDVDAIYAERSFDVVSKLRTTWGVKAVDVVETYKVTVNKFTEGLYSTHVEESELYYDASKTIVGGGTQIFSTE